MGQSAREGRVTQSVSQICRGPPLSIQQSTDQHMYVMKLPWAKEKTSENIRDNSAWAHAGLGIEPVPTSHPENLIIHRALGRDLRRVLPQQQRNN